MAEVTRLILCSRCRKQTHWENNPFRPFCSERCKKIDLGKWATGDYAIPIEEQESIEHESSLENSD